MDFKKTASNKIDEDSELFNLLQNSCKLAFTEGKIPVKYKILIVMSLDAAHGAVDRVKALAKQTIQAGATKKGNEGNKSNLLYMEPVVHIQLLSPLNKSFKFDVPIKRLQSKYIQIIIIFCDRA